MLQEYTLKLDSEWVEQVLAKIAKYDMTLDDFINKTMKNFLDRYSDTMEE